jgi:hypothetical protein
MKVFVFLAVLGVCYSDVFKYKCHKGDDWAAAKDNMADCVTADQGTIADAKCSMPAYIDAATTGNTKAYGCGSENLCSGPDETAKKCAICVNTEADKPCNKEMEAMTEVKYECMTYKAGAKAGDLWVDDKKDTTCTKNVKADASDDDKKAAKICRKATEAYQKDANGNADIKKGGCGACAEAKTIVDTKDAAAKKALEAGCTDNSGAAAMPFLMAPLLAVLFWLH